MDQRLILSLDLGTQSARAIVYRADGRILSSSRRLSEPYYSLQPAWAEVPQEQFERDSFFVLSAAVKQLSEKQRRQLAAVVITCNRDGLCPADEQDRLLRDWIVWADQRTSPEILDVLKRELPLYGAMRRLFGTDFFRFITTSSRYNWLRLHEADTYAKAKRYYSISAWITRKLTGEFADAAGMQCGVHPLDSAHMDWYRIPAVYQILGVRREQLPELKGAGEILGRISAEASARSGIPEGLPLFASSGDKQCEALGCGVFDEKSACLSYGTMASLSTCSRRFIGDRHKRFFCFPAARQGFWNPEFQIYRGYWLVTWFCRQYAEEGEMPAFLEQMNREAAQIPPGSHGLLVFPFWTAHRGLYPEGLGGVLGLTDFHTPADLYRAILESIAFALREGLEILEKKSGKKVERLLVTGGGSRSDTAMQITADIFGRPCARKSASEIGAAGAAICAGKALGIFPDYESAIATFSSQEENFTPDPKAKAIYERLYHDLYRNFYRQNRAAFRRLKALQSAVPDTAGGTWKQPNAD